MAIQSAPAKPLPPSPWIYYLVCLCGARVPFDKRYALPGSARCPECGCTARRWDRARHLPLLPQILYRCRLYLWRRRHGC